MMSFIHNGNDMRICTVFSGNKLDCIASYIFNSISLFIKAYFLKKVLLSFDDDAENILLGIFASSKHIHL